MNGQWLTTEKTTKLWVVLNEETLQIERQNVGGKAPAKFNTEEQANNWASERLNMWVAVEIFFNHRWLNHQVDEDFLDKEVNKKWGQPTINKWQRNNH